MQVEGSVLNYVLCIVLLVDKMCWEFYGVLVIIKILNLFNKFTF